MTIIVVEFIAVTLIIAVHAFLLSVGVEHLRQYSKRRRYGKKKATYADQGRKERIYLLY